MQPKISVLMSVYNGEFYLRQSVESILCQTFSDFELIIIDDCSTDTTWKSLSEYADRDLRIILLQNKENMGVTKSLNRGLAVAQGEYVARQDGDDVSLPERFEKQVALLDNHPEFVLASCNLELIDYRGRSIGKLQRACEPDILAWYLLFYNHLGGHSQVMFRRELVTGLGGYSEKFRYSQDYELWCRLSEVGKIAVLPEILMQYRSHDKNTSSQKQSEQKMYCLNQLRQNIEKLIDNKISLEEAEDLNWFWTTYLRHFPDSQRIQALHLRLKEIKQRFIQQGSQHNSFSPGISKQIDTLITQQFLSLIQSPLDLRYIKKSIILKIRISLYVISWYPLKVPVSWVIGLWKSMLHGLSTVIRLYRTNFRVAP